ncbi:hypothetical protein [Actinomadura sp. 3N508]|uniref:hypothetical protein n=1 Tax=Actinomadura sp. 3N508 TaxID=3375153 RepID=UPI00379C237C
MPQPASNVPLPAPSPAPPPDGRGPGVFVPQHVVATVACILVGSVAGVLVWLAPEIWLPIGAGITVTCLSLTLYGLWHQR